MYDPERGKILVRGIAYVPQSENSFSYWKDSEIRQPDFLESMKNLPVYIEHDPIITVGVVEDAFREEDTGKLIADLALQGPTPQIHDRLQKAIEHKYYKMLSLGHENMLQKDPDTGLVSLVDKRPVEVSLVKQGAIDGTFIIDYIF